MENERSQFLGILCCALRNMQLNCKDELTIGDFDVLFKLSFDHQVFPLIYNAVYSCESAKTLDPGYLQMMKRRMIQTVMMQTMKTAEFVNLYKFLNSKGVYPLVVKGIICRNLYPNPDYRPSGDEDMLIPESEFEKCHQAMLEYGMVLSDPAQDIYKEHEVPYGKPGSPIHIELHKQLFPPASEAYGDFNRFFEYVHEESVVVNVDGLDIHTLKPEDHLFYLITHAFKHFLHGGFGIRQVCDIVMFANKCGAEIDWSKVLKNCREINADVFAATLFTIGRKYLVFDDEKACYPKEWRNIEVDETMMLEDLLDSGVYGQTTMSRKHSSNITLDAVVAEKKGKKSNGVMKALFPSADALSGRYTYLQKYPVLLPVAWVQRILRYRKETAEAARENSAAEALKIGQERIELMRQYGILKKQPKKL